MGAARDRSKFLANWLDVNQVLKQQSLSNDQIDNTASPGVDHAASKNFLIGYHWAALTNFRPYLNQVERD